MFANHSLKDRLQAGTFLKVQSYKRLKSSISLQYILDLFT